MGDDLTEFAEKPPGTKALVITSQPGHIHLLTKWLAGLVSTVEVTDDLAFAEELLNISTVSVVIVDCTAVHPVPVEVMEANIQFAKTLISEKTATEVVIIRYSMAYYPDQCCWLGICSERKKVYCMSAPFNRDKVAETLAKRGIS